MEEEEGDTAKVHSWTQTIDAATIVATGAIQLNDNILPRSVGCYSDLCYHRNSLLDFTTVPYYF